MISPSNFRLFGIFFSTSFLIIIPAIWFLKYLKKLEVINQKKNFLGSNYGINHLGIIMDGNRRWAKIRNIDLKSSYSEGAEKLQEMIGICIENNINVLTVYALTIDNLKKRKDEEIDSIFSVLYKLMQEETDWFQKKKITVNFVGDFSYVPSEVRKKIEEFCEKTPKDGVLKLNILFSYDYLNDIEYGIKGILNDIKDGKIKESDLNEKSILKYIRSKDIVPVDLIIRTGNSERISGFLPLQSAYSEIVYFSCMWPEITKKMIIEIFEEFETKARNFGR